MNYSKFFFSMTQAQQDRYALRAGTTGNYLRTHVFVPLKRRKIPRRDKIESLVKAAKGAVSMDDVLSFLYKSKNGKQAA